ncbi:prealbumin-like fold domain-containing protein [Streptomyces longispororuber]|uniref:prealbumin-like fold domain-containing protein n=1 Tax=Streptomyces longispororuber TaxID=68230 RepID=UPI00210E30D8|nr:hypothetical protein [Streptomyces longispororuber]MCQ4214150.1 hypothetical protein [Streptomyces longispororuber]
MRWPRWSPVARWGGPALVALAVLAVLVGTAGRPGGQAAAAAAAAQNPLSVTFVARSCPQYSDVMANKARNNIQESLRDLGPDSNYASNEAVSAAKEAAGTPLPPCQALPGWTFSTGRGISNKSDATLNLSTVTTPIRQNITTGASTPELDAQGNPTGRQLEGAVTVPLNSAEISASSGLVVQGGTKSATLNGMQEQYGFAALRCAQDAFNGDNVEYVSFPSGARHVFCYYYAITPPPDAGTITVVKKVAPDSPGEGQFRFDGTLSYGDTNGDGTNDFVLGALAQRQASQTFVRAAGGEPWTFKEVVPPGSGWVAPTMPDCTIVAAGGGEGSSQVQRDSAGAVSVVLAAGDTVTCTYTNTRASGGALLEKESIGGTGTFDIDVQPPSGSAPFDVSPVTTTRQGVPVTVVEAPDGALPGHYEVSEKVPAPDGTGTWELVGANCNGTDVPITRTDPDEADPNGRWHASYDVTSAADARCLLTNRFTPGGAIDIEKVTEGGTGTFSYAITSHPRGRAALVPHTDRATATTVTEGVPVTAHPDGSTTGPAVDQLAVDNQLQYMVQEFMPPATAAGHWELVDADCGDAELRVDRPSASVTLVLTPDQPRPTCRFTNRFVPVGTLDVTKHTTGDTGLRPDGAELTLSCADGTTDTLTVASGTTSAQVPRHTFAADTTCTLSEPETGAGDGVDVTTTATVSVDGGTPTKITLGDPFPVRAGEAVTVEITNAFATEPPTSPPPTTTPTTTPTPTATPPATPTPTPTVPTPGPSGGPSVPPGPPGDHLADTGGSTTALWVACAGALAVALGTLTVTAMRRRT